MGSVAFDEGIFKESVCIDFDGVIHKYSKGYIVPEIYDGVVEGAAEAIRKLHKHYRIIIHTSRIVKIMTMRTVIIDEVALLELKEYLKKHSIEYDEIIPKPIAAAYIDDRAVYIDYNAGIGWNKIKEQCHGLLKHIERIF